MVPVNPPRKNRQIAGLALRTIQVSPGRMPFKSLRLDRVDIASFQKSDMIYNILISRIAAITVDLRCSWVMSLLDIFSPATSAPRFADPREADLGELARPMGIGLNTARKINVRAAQIGTDAGYDDQWGDGS
jgi:hypothetical protein